MEPRAGSRQSVEVSLGHHEPFGDERIDQSSAPIRLVLFHGAHEFPASERPAGEGCQGTTAQLSIGSLEAGLWTGRTGGT